LVRIGFTDVADMIGGMAGWLAAGLPVVEPTESHLGL
jgi:rhodanese-related sulfurtransferase